MKTTHYCLFHDDESGEAFYVEKTSLEAAKKEAKEWFNDPHFIRVDSPLISEISGYDVY